MLNDSITKLLNSCFCDVSSMRERILMQRNFPSFSLNYGQDDGITDSNFTCDDGETIHSRRELFRIRLRRGVPAFVRVKPFLIVASSNRDQKDVAGAVNDDMLARRNKY
ncbi:hypothetical protein Trydic_g8108 [Trypoxylus dichotomus]